MEVYILSQAQFTEITKRLDDLQEQLAHQATSVFKKPFMDNEEFLAFMGISRRTAQSWRDEGKISFSQVGQKIYYKRCDVEKLLNEYYNKSFKR